MESKRLESRKTLRSGADKLAGTMISNFKNTLELTQRRELEELKRRESQPIVVEPYLCKFELVGSEMCIRDRLYSLSKPTSGMCRKAHLSTLNFMKNISQEKIGLGNLTSATDWLHGFPFTLIKSTF